LKGLKNDNRLIEKDGVKFWIQKKWLRADNTLTPAGERAFEQAKADLEEKAKGEKYYNVKPFIQKETEKAVMIAVNVDVCNIERNVTRNFWFPKSQMKNGYAAEWFLNKKIAETKEQIYNQFNTGGIVDSIDCDDFIYINK